MGSEYSIHTQDHSFNLENTHYQFFSNMTEKRHMDGVVATGDALTSYYRQKASLTEGTERAKFEGLYEFLDKQIVLNVLKEQEFGLGNFSKKKFTYNNVFYKKGARGLRGKQTFTISPYKALLMLKNFTTGTSMWLKPLAGTFNGAIVLTFNTARGLGGTLATTAGVPPDQVDFTLSDLAYGYKETAKYYYDVIRGRKRDNKLFNIADRYGYLPDNYDYAVDNSDMVALKNPHAIHEEHGHLALLAAQMRRIKMKDGSSLYDNYRNDGTFIGQKNNKQNIRGIRRLPTGEIEVIDELTSEELNRMLKVSTTVHGAYRSDEKSVMEAHVIGQFFLQFKKYLPALLMQEWQSKNDDTFLGYFDMTDAQGNMRKEKVRIQRETIDENGNSVKVDQEIETSVMDWHASQHQGRARVMLQLLLGGNPLHLKGRFEDLNADSYNETRLRARENAIATGRGGGTQGYYDQLAVDAGINKDKASGLYASVGEGMKYRQQLADQSSMFGQLGRDVPNVLDSQRNAGITAGAGANLNTLGDMTASRNYTDTQSNFLTSFLQDSFTGRDKLYNEDGKVIQDKKDPYFSFLT